mmetsp:Transcript_44748/g.136534  ORF Transcript_44748/g.136534 Transcript_44748/m.136534 type:complete len:111 (+) Transcript_44748:614-946(+)
MISFGSTSDPPAMKETTDVLGRNVAGVDDPVLKESTPSGYPTMHRANSTATRKMDRMFELGAKPRKSQSSSGPRSGSNTSVSRVGWYSLYYALANDAGGGEVERCVVGTS